MWERIKEHCKKWDELVQIIYVDVWRLTVLFLLLVILLKE